MTKKTTGTKAVKATVKKKIETRPAVKAVEKPKLVLKSAFKKKEMEPYRRMLLSLKDSLLKEVLVNDDASKESNEGEVLDLADLASDAYDKDLANSISETERSRLRAVEQALERVSQGTYGVCQTCAKPIPLARLKTLPFARLCVSCQSDEERTTR